jgi:hypothetical protein
LVFGRLKFVSDFVLGGCDFLAWYREMREGSRVELGIAAEEMFDSRQSRAVCGGAQSRLL